jgi:hypothetical protein
MRTPVVRPARRLPDDDGHRDASFVARPSCESLLGSRACNRLRVIDAPSALPPIRVTTDGTTRPV